MTERELQAKVTRRLYAAGYDLQFHVVDQADHAIVTGPGFPDLVALHPERQPLVVEFKTDRNQPTKWQWPWLQAWARVLPGCVHLWQPRHMEAIVAGIDGGGFGDCPCRVCKRELGEGMTALTGPAIAMQTGSGCEKRFGGGYYLDADAYEAHALGLTLAEYRRRSLGANPYGGSK